MLIFPKLQKTLIIIIEIIDNVPSMIPDISLILVFFLINYILLDQFSETHRSNFKNITFMGFLSFLDFTHITSLWNTTVDCFLDILPAKDKRRREVKNDILKGPRKKMAEIFWEG